MKATFISTTTLWNSPRTSLDKLQKNLVKANTELTTGRYADVGLQLGNKTGDSLSLRQQLSELEALTESNNLALQRLESSTAALDSIRETATKFRDALAGLPVGNPPVATIKSEAEAYLESLVSDLNTAVGGQFLFGGINTKTTPVVGYDGGTPLTLRTVVMNTFSQPVATGGFGFPQSSAAVSTISAFDMETFLDGPFTNLFNGADWDTFSNASNQNIQSQISPTEKVDTSTNANTAAMRQIAMAYTMIYDLGIENMNPEARDVVIKKSAEVLSNAVTDLILVQAELGTSESKVNNANERMGLQQSIFKKQVGNLESVDPAEAKVRVDKLMTQIETSFSLTAQLRQLNLINYI